MMEKQVIQFAKEFGFDGAEFCGKWKGYDVYRPTYRRDEVMSVGRPQYIFVLEGLIRMADEEEVFAYLDSLPDDDA